MKRSEVKTTLFLAGITILVLIITSNINWGGNRSKNIIRSDAKCYYLYLPGIFIYDDLNFGFVRDIEFDTYKDEFNCRDCREYIDGRAFSKVTAGVAMAQTPFFLGSHLVARVFGFPADGYSKPYQIGVTVAAIFYLFIGLWFLNGFLAAWNIRPNSRIVVMICCVFGTNLFYYTIGEPGLSHIFSFAFINMLVYFVRQYFVGGKSKYIYWSGIALGIIFLIRPVNLIILPGLFALAGDRQNLTQKLLLLKQHYLPVLGAVLFFCLLIGVQVVIFMIQTGRPWIYTYGDESFDFTKPEIINILFSYRKGLFLYTPLYLLSVFGLFFLFKRYKLSAILCFVFLLFFTFVVSSWWSWWYGGSFSSRVYVDILVFFMFPLACMIDAVHKKLHRILLLTGLFLILALCQIQTYQYRYYQIHWSDMTKEKYWDNFLRIDKI